MSSNLLHDISNILHMQGGKRFVVSNGREGLAEFVRDEMARRGWSYGEIVRRSGNHIKSASTLGNIVNGHVVTVSEDTLKGLAHAFEVQPDRLFQIYYGKANSSQLDEQGAVDFQQLPGGDYIIRLQPPTTPGMGLARSTSKSRKLLLPVDLSPEIVADVELMVSMFLDIPRDCQLDTLASLAGVHQRRRLSAKIHERHEARAEARQTLDKHKPKDKAPDRNGLVEVAASLRDYKGDLEDNSSAEVESDVPAKKQA